MWKNTVKYHKYGLLFIATIAIFYGAFAYDLIRTDFTKLLLLYAGLFFISYKLVQRYKTNFWLLAGLALLFRLVFLFAIPNLSQDFYRFIWDGRLLSEGINPYLSTPEQFIKAQNFRIIPQAELLYEGMGSLNAGHFTNYPPVCQVIYALAGKLFKDNILGSVLVMRLFLIAADMGTLYFGKKLLEKLNLPVHRIFWYILNPFIIIELTGNLHFEGVMVFFLLISLFFLYQRKWRISAILLGLSISVKLIPLLFLPLFFQYFKKNYSSGFLRLIGFYCVVALTVLLTFLPFLSVEFLQNFSISIGLWFQKFEFNASIYYLVRWLGFQIVGYNIIQWAGIGLSLVTFIGILLLSFFKKNTSIKTLFLAMLFSFGLYLLMTTTVHPWYLVTLVALSVFTNYKFPLVWSFMIVLSYLAYGSNGFYENLWVVALEYLMVIMVFIFEYRNLKVSRILRKG